MIDGFQLVLVSVGSVLHGLLVVISLCLFLSVVSIAIIVKAIDNIVIIVIKVIITTIISIIVKAVGITAIIIGYYYGLYSFHTYFSCYY